MLNTPFKIDVFKGLTAFPKFLYSKYIYDKKGDQLFQDIMAMPSYYLTNCEHEILSKNASAITEYFSNGTTGFDLIELGAGDGKKTKVLLSELTSQKIDFIYKPIDISQNAIDSLALSLKTEAPNVKVAAEIGEYFEVLKRLKTCNTRKTAIMILGSNIGNLLHPKAIDFLSQLNEAMSLEDMVLIGFDQKKDPQTVLNAYNDPEGITEAFNKNLLTRINTEMNANFDTDTFKHWEVYNPETGTAKSYLVSTKKQEVTIAKLELTIAFDKWETIHTEISQKYDDKIVSWLAEESGLTIIDSFMDDKGYYKNYLFKKKI
jgi:dimethylhistidine N-methyltransferase